MRVIGCLLAATVVLAGCAQNDDPSRPGRSRTDAPAPSEAAAPPEPETALVDPRDGGLELGFGEYAITLESAEIRPGRVTFVVRNGGTMIHGFEIESEDDDAGLKFEGPAMGPGDVVRLEADLAPGTYKIECFVDGHDDLGMEALLVVRPDAPLVRVEPADDGGVVAIEGFAFSPDELEVPAGTELVWRNEDPTAHTVTEESGAFDSGTLDAGGTFSTVLDRPGPYAYLCQIHPTMRGTIRVTDA